MCPRLSSPATTDGVVIEGMATRPGAVIITLQPYSLVRLACSKVVAALWAGSTKELTDGRIQLCFDEKLFQ